MFEYFYLNTRKNELKSHLSCRVFTKAWVKGLSLTYNLLHVAVGPLKPPVEVGTAYGARARFFAYAFIVSKFVYSDRRINLCLVE